MAVRFCAYQYQHLPLDELGRRWLLAEQLGFDVLWNADTVVEPDRARHMMFDGPATLTLMAAQTTRIRVGTLVNTHQLRHPVTLARAVATVDHLSGGRVEVAVGVGDPSAGGPTLGVAWSAGESVHRFAEFVEVLDILLRQEVTDYEGRFYRCAGAEVIPACVQRPRPPLTIAAHGPRMLRLAAKYADGWNSWGGNDIETEADIYRVTAERTKRFDDLCAEYGRDPRSIQHSLVCYPPLTPWESSEYFADMVGRLRAIGIDEFVLYLPESWRTRPEEWDVFEQVATTQMPTLRAAM
jgi:alkanesulfonate monooxygenase SsuD/methylene tetrahydromethanopterin reductase-like flavin-dependent oxidoreductase (luciferase family)